MDDLMETNESNAQLDMVQVMEDGNISIPLDMISEDNHHDEIYFPQQLISEEFIPKIGMEFVSESAAYQFYQNYAKKTGFGTRMSRAHKDKQNDIVLDRVFCCCREGKRTKDKRNATVKCPRPETRCNCTARMKISCRENGKYQVVLFQSHHNHQLSTPSKTHFFRSFRNMTTAHKAEVDLVKSCGVAPKQIMEIMSKEAGGRENLGFIRDDLKNYLHSKRSMAMKNGDTGGVLEYLQRMQLEDPNFFYAIQVDEDDLITNIFWVDARMRTDFSRFGDVVCFDTTYRKHKDGRPIALFVGINHHKQTTIFGAALLYDETIKTFEWLFDIFSRAMMGKTPKTILTDQDGRMATALASQWPATYHRLCIWHIYQNAAIHLADTFFRFKDFADDFSNCIYDHEEVDDFFCAWNQLLKKYNLEDNTWLQKLFDIKEKWALVYGRKTFCADITTTQRSETMNSVLKRYVSYKNDLLEFFNHFQRLLNDRRYEESRADFRCSQSTPALIFPVAILKHAAIIYTHDVFEKFKDELCKGIDCSIECDKQLGDQMIYKITPPHKHYHHFVTYDPSKDFVCCSCKKFEFAGILCSHVLKVFTTLSVTVIPNEYILKRWTKAAKKGIMRVYSANTGEIDEKAKISARYKELSHLFMQLVTKAAESEEAYEFAKNKFWKMSEEIDGCSGKGKKVEETPSLTFEVERPSQSVVLSSEIDESGIKGVKVKDKITYNTSKRPKNALERAIKKYRYRAKGKSPLTELQQL